MAIVHLYERFRPPSDPSRPCSSCQNNKFGSNASTEIGLLYPLSVSGYLKGYALPKSEEGFVLALC
jgi:hypothetical protein